LVVDQRGPLGRAERGEPRGLVRRGRRRLVARHLSAPDEGRAGEQCRDHEGLAQCRRIRLHGFSVVDGQVCPAPSKHPRSTPGQRIRSGLAPRSCASVPQYSFLITKNEPRMVPASFDFWRANLKRSASSAGTSIPSESLKPTARFLLSASVYITLIDRPLS